MTCLNTLFRRCARTARAFLTASVRSHRIALGGAAIGLALVSCASVPELMPPRPLRIEIQSGKIAEEWVNRDELAMLTQIATVSLAPL